MSHRWYIKEILVKTITLLKVDGIIYNYNSQNISYILVTLTSPHQNVNLFLMIIFCYRIIKIVQHIKINNKNLSELSTSSISILCISTSTNINYINYIFNFKLKALYPS